MRLARTTFELPAGTFHALIGGPAESAGGAPPLLYLHGFPDHPPTATPFLDELARTRRVIAPWLRGYAPSPRVVPYDVATLVGDVLALIDQIAPARGVVDLVGHDWGAVITYAVCAQTPDRVRRAVTMAVPHPLTFLRALRHPSQAVRSSYMALFQLPGAGLAMRASFAIVDRLWRLWSPSFRLDPRRSAELRACLAESWPAPLAYYRAALRPLRTTRARLREASRPILTPLLQLHGAEDGCILPPSGDDARLFRERELDVRPGLGHFLHHEDPVGIAARALAWLR